MRRWLIALALLTTPLTQAQQDTTIDTIGDHQVRSGETLSGITALYLGDGALWRENWKLNPQIEDPDRLQPGLRVTVIKERRVIAQNARVKSISNQVDKNLQRTQWLPAQQGDELQERDGVRTLRASSAELQFNNNSTLRLSEYSQIFLETKQTTQRGVDRGRIEVREGSAELVFAPISPKRTEIELVAGSSVATAVPDASGRGQLRSSTADGGAAQVMVYEGSSEVAAAGATVEVPRGFGTAVPQTGPPSAPEQLLAAPRGLSAGPGRRWRVANEIVNWQPVAGASSYVVEVCRDSDCGNLVARAQVTDPSWQANLETTGELFVRVSAMADSKLLGYASQALGFSLDTDYIDREPPVIALAPIGGQRAAKADWLVGAATKLRVLAHDRGAGVASVEYRWDDADWQPWSGQDLSLPDSAATLTVRAVDGLGLRGEQTIELIDATPAG